MGIFDNILGRNMDKRGALISKAALSDILKFSSSPRPDEVDLPDAMYRCVTRKDIDWMVSHLNTGPTWRYNAFDCNKKAIHVQAQMNMLWADNTKGEWANAFGIAEGVVRDKDVFVGHWWNWWAADNAQVYWFEPGNLKFFSGDRIHKLYTLRGA
jgi:hypothetical protein